MKGDILRSKGVDGLFHTRSEAASGTKTKPNRKIECMKDADVCRNCTRTKCSGTQKCVEKRKKELQKLSEE